MATSDLRELILSARHRIANAKQDPVAAIHRDEFLEMIRAARSHLAAMRGMTDAELLEYVEDIFDGSLVVAGLIPDPKAADGARACILKGSREIMVPVAEGRPLKVEMMNVIPCVTFEQAATFERLFGNGKRLNARPGCRRRSVPAAPLRRAGREGASADGRARCQEGAGQAAWQSEAGGGGATRRCGRY